MGAAARHGGNNSGASKRTRLIASFHAAIDRAWANSSGPVVFGAPLTHTGEVRPTLVYINKMLKEVFLPITLKEEESHVFEKRDSSLRSE
jgi:hypothetical protein